MDSGDSGPRVTSRAIRNIALAVLGTLAPTTLGAEPAYLGSSACGSCHPSQYASQAQSDHARTLHRAIEHPLARSFVSETGLRRDPGYLFAFRQTPGAVEVTVSNGESRQRLPLEWAFGAGGHGVTFVSRVNEQSHIEHAFSYYTKAGAFDLTPGQEKLQPKTIYEAMGVLYPTQSHAMAVTKCFACHTTGPVTVSDKGEVATFENGVRCEACHGPGDNHLQAVRRGDLEQAKMAIQRPGEFPSEEITRLCGECHRMKADFELSWFEDKWNVRHQPAYFQQSRCYQESEGRLSCFTCHDAHRNVRRGEPAHYRQKCVQCHASGLNDRHAQDVSTSDCTACHMPKVQINSHLSFQNHWIGVYGGESKLIPTW
jgi:hypothetical protein